MIGLANALLISKFYNELCVQSMHVACIVEVVVTPGLANSLQTQNYPYMHMYMHIYIITQIYRMTVQLGDRRECAGSIYKQLIYYPLLIKGSPLYIIKSCPKDA